MKKYAFSYSGSDLELNKAFPLDVFDVSASVSRRYREGFLIELCSKGFGLSVIDGKIYSFQAGDVVILGPKVYHRMRPVSEAGASWSCIAFRPADWGDVAFPDDLKLVIPKDSAPLLVMLINQIRTEYDASAPDRQRVIRGLLAAMLPYIKREDESVRTGAEKAGDSPKPDYLDTRIVQAIDILLDNQGSKELSIVELAGACQMSVSNFRSLFKAQVLMSPKRYQTELKLKKAVLLLRFTRLRVLEIATTCGFQSVSSSNRSFYDSYGVSPGQIRKGSNDCLS